MPNPNDGVIAGYANTLNSTSPAGGAMTGPLSVGGLITASAGVSSSALPTGYLGWSISPEVLSPTAIVLTTAYGYLTRVYVPVAGVTTYLDVAFTTANAVTNAVWGLYTGTGVNPIAYTAEAHTTVSGTANVYSIPWSSPVTLSPGSYYVYQEVTGTTPSMAGVTATSTGSVGATILNPNCSLSGGTLNSASLASGAPTAITGTTTLAFGTSWALSASKLWYGLR